MVFQCIMWCLQILYVLMLYPWISNAREYLQLALSHLEHDNKSQPICEVLAFWLFLATTTVSSWEIVFNYRLCLWSIILVVESCAFDVSHLRSFCWGKRIIILYWNEKWWHSMGSVCMTSYFVKGCHHCVSWLDRQFE